LNNTVENDFIWVKWLHLTVEVDKSVRLSCQIFSGNNIPKSLKSVHFYRVIQKNEKVDVLGGHSVVALFLIFALSDGLSASSSRYSLVAMEAQPWVETDYLQTNHIATEIAFL